MILMSRFGQSYSISGGTLMDRQHWIDISTQFVTAQQRFRETLRGSFARRIARRFGHSFYQSFVHRILPPNEFLESQEKNRMYNPVSKRLSTNPLRMKPSRYRCDTAVERYPIGCLLR